MLSKERIAKNIRFEKVDRMPVMEWAPYWDLTVKRWSKEGMAADLNSRHEVRKYFNLDPLVDFWVSSKGKNCPRTEYGKPIVKSIEEYNEFRQYLYTDDIVSDEEIENAANEQKQYGSAAFLWIWGFFWTPREILGIEDHLYAFYDESELMDMINQDQLNFIKRTVERISKKVELQFVVLGEDMSYKCGSMISKEMFENRLVPFYKEIIPYLKNMGIKVIVDSDGLVDLPLEWYVETGFDGMLPMERQAGVDIVKYREKHPKFCFIGAFNKLLMNKGEAAMREEFERLLPVMKKGGYILGVDHQTPPEVSMEDYKLYLKLLNEYAIRAVV